jgi:Nif-specific regulatory protein
MNNDFLSNTTQILNAILDTSVALNVHQSLRANLSSVTDILLKRLDLTFCFVLIYESEIDKLVPYSNSGLSIAKFRRLESKADKTILRQSFNSNKSIIIPQISFENSLVFLENETEQSLICLPLSLKKNCLGLLTVGFNYQENVDFEQLTVLLGIIANLISQTLKIERAVADEREKLLQENTNLRQELKEKHNFGQIIGNSSQMRQIYDQVSQIARANNTVLLRGESGTGKEMIANAIHYNSLRSKRPFIKFDSASMPNSLIENELFGTENKQGKIEQADGGTLYIEEIADLPLQVQAKLLKTLETKEFERIGGNDKIIANFRLITASCKNLEEEVLHNQFNQELLNRLSVYQIFLPPLRERKADILLLAEHFVEKFEREHGKFIKRISTPAIDMLTSYHFPGNVRELENAIERAVLVCDSNVIHGHHLPPTLQTAELSGTVTAVSLENAVESYEKDLIQDALKSTRGNVAKAAKLLNSTERILGYKIKKYEIRSNRFK